MSMSSWKCDSDVGNTDLLNLSQSLLDTAYKDINGIVRNAGKALLNS